MPISILMPALSPTMTKGNLVKWHKQEGDVIKAGQVLAEIETDKATMEIEAVDEGILGKILVAQGTSDVAVNAPIGVILEEGEDASVLATFTPEGAPTAAALKLEKPQENVVSFKAASDSIASAQGASSDRIKASPLAKRIASKHNIPLATLQGSGPYGRVVKQDVEGALASGGRDSMQSFTKLPTGGFFSGFEPAAAPQPISMVRRVVAKRLTESKQMIPHFYVSVDCEVDALLEARKSLNSQTEAQGVKISVNDILIRACALTLRQLPEANAAWAEDAIHFYDQVDVAVAVSIEGGLITPVIRNAASKGILHLSQEMKTLASRAREGKLKPEEFQGGTFTLSNMGMYGVQSFSAILNPPQACILAVGAGEKRPVVRGNAIVPATMMTVTLSVDHRVVDGAVAAKFLQIFKAFVEKPVTMLL
ncbi:MAG: pyruvate dehydrogenase complex dihydrolipoamide acetyltransferase [Alphaproteobacteria bacterium]